MSTRMATFCVTHILEHGASGLDALAAAARAAEMTRARNPGLAVRNALQHDPRLVALPDGRWDCGLRLLARSTLTHRVRAATTGRDLLFPGVELAPLMVFLEHAPLPLTLGGEIHLADGRTYSQTPVIIGPDGWLPDVPADALVGLTWTGSGLTARTVDVDPQDPETAFAMKEAAGEVRAVMSRHAHAHTASARPAKRELARTLWAALIEAPGLLSAPVPPLDEVLALPPVAWPAGWRSELVSNGRPMVLTGLPDGLAGALERHAIAIGRTAGELAIEHLAAAAWRWDQPCRHDLARRDQPWYDDPRPDEEPYPPNAYVPWPPLEP